MSRAPGRLPGFTPLAAAAVWTGMALFACLFTYLTWRRQDAFGMGRFDLGNMSQAVWSSAHGRLLDVTDAAGNQMVRLGIHVDPVLVLLAPVYWAWADPKALLAIQALVVAAGALPVWWLARAELGKLAGAGLPVAFVAAYLLYPPLQYSTLTEFHPVTLAAPLLLYCIWFLRQERHLPFAVFAVLAAATKEEVALLLAALGIYAAVVWRDRRAGLVTALLGAAWFAVATQLVIPHFNEGGASELLGRYQAVGGDVPGMLKTLVTDPWRIVAVAFTGPKVGYLAALVGALLLLPLAAPGALLVAMPELAVNLLSAQPAQSSFRFHYVAAIVPFLVWAAILGARRLLADRQARLMLRGARPWLRSGALSGLLVGGALVAGWLMGPIPWWSHLPRGSRYLEHAYSPDRHDAIASRALGLIPPTAPVSATNHLGAHLSERKRILTFPQVLGADFVIVDERDPSFGDQNGTADQAAALVALREDPAYRVLFSQDGVVVFGRVVKADRSTSSNQSTSTAFRAATDHTKPAPSRSTSP